MIKFELKRYWRLVALAVVLLISFSCSKDSDDIIDPTPVDPDPVVVETSKTFIYDHFKANYLWLDELPVVDPNTFNSNEDLVDSLRYKEVDRWSFITSLEEYNKLFEQGETKGFGVGMSYLEETGNLFVRFTYPKSPMGRAGVNRGWEFLKINDISISDFSDYKAIIAAFNTDSELNFTFLNLAGETVNYSMARADYEISTVLHHSVIPAGDKKVGYLVYESFIGDTSIDELNLAFSDFDAEGIDEVIVDLRYNGGGRLDLAFSLSALVGGNDVLNKLFTTVKYNSKRTSEEKNWGILDPVANSVNLSRLYFITTSSSASASEMVINSLFPYKEVILIGSKTHGKPVGMEVKESEEYNIALAAITFQLLNAHGNGHYFTGIPVDYEVEDDIFKAWGDPQEACLKKALGLISGDDQVALKSTQFKAIPMPLKRGLQEITGAY